MPTIRGSSADAGDGFDDDHDGSSAPSPLRRGSMPVRMGDAEPMDMSSLGEGLEPKNKKEGRRTSFDLPPESSIQEEDEDL